MTGSFVLTFDAEWAPDFVVLDVARQLVDRRVKATWFVTDENPSLSFLRAHADLFELGIHPNFRPGSSHGATVDAVLAHCMAMVPEARSMRTHGLVQSTQILARVLATTPIRVDSSLLLPYAKSLAVTPFTWARQTLLRVPYFWEDDSELQKDDPIFGLDFIDEADPGLKVFDFHPLAIAVNYCRDGQLDYLAQNGIPWQNATREHVATLTDRSRPGSATMFQTLLDRFERGVGSLTVSEAAILG